MIDTHVKTFVVLFSPVMAAFWADRSMIAPMLAFKLDAKLGKDF